MCRPDDFAVATVCKFQVQLEICINNRTCSHHQTSISLLPTPAPQENENHRVSQSPSHPQPRLNLNLTFGSLAPSVKKAPARHNRLTSVCKSDSIKQPGRGLQARNHR